jgi:hypothetical protein
MDAFDEASVEGEIEMPQAETESSGVVATTLFAADAKDNGIFTGAFKPEKPLTMASAAVSFEGRAAMLGASSDDESPLTDPLPTLSEAEPALALPLADFALSLRGGAGACSTWAAVIPFASVGVGGLGRGEGPFAPASVGNSSARGTRCCTAVDVGPRGPPRGGPRAPRIPSPRDMPAIFSSSPPSACPLGYR